ncbi:MAG: hypothetical protein OXG22_03485, partial [Chloroflexi bacterium]|nr:hypothetical protein [Chloroflexota bacterium]
EVWRLGIAGRMDEAFRLFAPLTVWLTFTLTDMELFNVLEKRLLMKRGALNEPATRPATQHLGADLLEHADFLAEQVIRAADGLSTEA